MVSYSCELNGGHFNRVVFVLAFCLVELEAAIIPRDR